MVREQVFNERNLDMINEEYFTQDVIATSNGDIKGLENFKGIMQIMLLDSLMEN